MHGVKHTLQVLAPIFIELKFLLQQFDFHILLIIAPMAFINFWAQFTLGDLVDRNLVVFEVLVFWYVFAFTEVIWNFGVLFFFDDG